MLNAEGGLWKLGARFYDSSKNSFIQQDRYMGDPGDPLSLNRYVYCGLDPVNYIDPTGFSFLPPWLDKAWLEFQTGVGLYNGFATGTAVRGNLINGRIIDWLTSCGRAIEAKYVQNIESTAQLRDFISQYGNKFELWITDYTKTIAPSLLKLIQDSGGKVVTLVNGVSKVLDLESLRAAGGVVSDSCFLVVPEYMVNGLFYRGDITGDSTSL